MVVGMIQRRRLLKEGGQKIKDVMDISKPHIWKRRNGFLDIDVNLHMNNASFTYNCEMARYHYSGITGLIDVAFENRWAFIVASHAYKYKKPMPPFVKYEIQTKVEAIDEKFLYISHIFTSPTNSPDEIPAKVYCQGTVKAAITGRKGTVAPAEAFLKIGYSEEEIKTLSSPKNIPLFEHFLNWDKAANESLRSALSPVEKTV
eukprot:Awhi_evm1s10339